MAFLSGAEIGGTVYRYEPDPMHVMKRSEKKMEARFGPVRLAGEGLPLEGNALDRIRDARGEWPLYEATAGFPWGGKGNHGVKALGQLYSNGTLWAVYVVDDMRTYAWVESNEKGMRRQTERHTHRELKGLFVTLRERDVDLLEKKARTRKDKELNPRFILPSSVYSDYRVFHISEAEAVQELTGRYERYRSIWKKEESNG
jgi:hypothetical protein